MAISYKQGISVRVGVCLRDAAVEGLVGQVVHGFGAHRDAQEEVEADHCCDLENIL